MSEEEKERVKDYKRQEGVRRQKWHEIMLEGAKDDPELAEIIKGCETPDEIERAVSADK